jgi:hypothetical protein
MKISVPTTNPGRVTKIPGALPPVAAGRAIIEPTEDQLVDLAEGKTYWTPTGEGTGTLSVPPTRVPAEIPAWKGRTILRLTPAGEGTLWDAVQAAIAALPTQQKVAAEEVLGGTVWARNSPTLSALAAALSLTSEQVDALFVAAAAIVG